MVDTFFIKTMNDPSSYEILSAAEFQSESQNKKTRRALVVH